MKQLKKQIQDSFFNPIIYFLPILVFLQGDSFWGTYAAWKVSFPVAFGLLFYVYFFYNRMFLWHLFLSAGYLIIGVGAFFFPKNLFISSFVDDLLFLMLLVYMFLRKPFFEKMASKTISHNLPMSNNENELFRVAKIIFVIVLCYVIVMIIIKLTKYEDRCWIAVMWLKYTYLSTVAIMIILETAKVIFVRCRLLKEDWLPIVDARGKVLGSVQYQPEFKGSSKKHLHPCVRLYFVKKGTLLLQQRKVDDISDPFRWDASLSRHVRISESVDMVLKNYTCKLYNFAPNMFLFLTNYIFDGKFNDQLIYLFVACETEPLKPNEDEIFQVKWWIPKQIEDNLGTGIFTERFEMEYEFMKRSGIFDVDACECECELKRLIKSKQKSDKN